MLHINMTNQAVTPIRGFLSVLLLVATTFSFLTAARAEVAIQNGAVAMTTAAMPLGTHCSATTTSPLPTPSSSTPFAFLPTEDFTPVSVEVFDGDRRVVVDTSSISAGPPKVAHEDRHLYVGRDVLEGYDAGPEAGFCS